MILFILLSLAVLSIAGLPMYIEYCEMQKVIARSKRPSCKCHADEDDYEF